VWWQPSHAQRHFSKLKSQLSEFRCDGAPQKVWWQPSHAQRYFSKLKSQLLEFRCDEAPQPVSLRNPDYCPQQALGTVTSLDRSRNRHFSGSLSGPSLLSVAFGTVTPLGRFRDRHSSGLLLKPCLLNLNLDDRASSLAQSDLWITPGTITSLT